MNMDDGPLIKNSNLTIQKTCRNFTKSAISLRVVSIKKI